MSGSPSPRATAPGPRLSLRTRLIRHVTLPLLLTWALGAAVALGIAAYFTQRAFDRSMLDDAYLIAAHLGQSPDGSPVLNMSSDDIRTVLFDQSEVEYFAVLASDGRLIAGHPGLRPPANFDTSEPHHVDLAYQGQNLRAVVLKRDQPVPVWIVVALTTRSRQALLRELVLFSMAPQALLLLGLTWWLRRVVSRDLQPLSQLQGLIESRDAADLSPLPAPLIEAAATRDVHGLATSIDALLGRVAHGLTAQREFAGNVAHELRTPLSGIRAAAEYGLAQPQQGRDQLLAVLKSQQRASHLVDQLLAIALAQEAATAICLQPLDLSDCVRDQLLHFLPAADLAGMELEASGLDDGVRVNADRALVEGLLANLLDNALRYGRGADGHGRLTVSVSRRPGQVVLSVRDQGPGIGEVQRESLKQRWQQGPDGTALGAGAGLGLAIVQRYAELMQAEFVLAAADCAPCAQGRAAVGLNASVIFRSLP